MNNTFQLQTNGKWLGILSKFIGAKYLTGRHCGCPLCGEGTDRFRFDDKEGNGTFICNYCGAGSGLHLLASYQNITHKDAAKMVYDILPEIKDVPNTPPQIDKHERVKKIWAKREKIVHGDNVQRYLESRGITGIPPTLFKVQHGVYQDKVWIPLTAMVAKCVNNGKATGLHFTFLKDGKKADVESQRQIYSAGDGILNGSVIKLHEPKDGTILIAEGIETALSAAVICNLPAWATMTAGMMERVNIPDGITQVIICADHDLSFTGQAAAYTLAKRLVNAGLTVDVMLPAMGDWNDTLRQELKIK